MSSDPEHPSKSNEKSNQKKEKTTGYSFLQNIKGSLSGKSPKKEGDEINQKSSKQAARKFTGDASDSPNKNEKAKKKNERVSQNSEEDPTLYFINNLKEHETVQSLRKRKNTIIKVVASTISGILIIIGIIYGLSPTDQVASNVIFGERAMFAVFLILVAFLILAAVFASRLLKGKFLKDIHQNLEIVEGKKQKDDHKNSNEDPLIERMNKKG